MLLEKKTRYINVLGNQPQHCATICSGKQGPLIAAYVGRELTDAQQVFVLNTGDKNSNPVALLPPKTGNPLLWNDKEGRNWLLYSMFEDKDADGNMPSHIVHRWMYCSNWLSEVKVEKSGKVILEPARRIDSMFGHLARCQPLWYKDELLIPMYVEKDPYCVLYKFKGGELQRFSEFARIPNLEKKYQGSLGAGGIIQPTLFHLGDKLAALCRNCLRRGYNSNTWFGTSDDAGKTWSAFKQIDLRNNNSSIVALDNGWFVHNDADGRVNMVLSKLKDPGESTWREFAIPLQFPMEPLGNARENFAYPNFMYSGARREYHIVHTNCGYIAWHMMPEELLS